MFTKHDILVTCIIRREKQAVVLLVLQSMQKKEINLY